MIMQQWENLSEENGINDPCPNEFRLQREQEERGLHFNAVLITLLHFSSLQLKPEATRKTLQCIFVNYSKRLNLHTPWWDALRYWSLKSLCISGHFLFSNCPAILRSNVLTISSKSSGFPPSQLLFPSCSLTLLTMLLNYFFLHAPSCSLTLLTVLTISNVLRSNVYVFSSYMLHIKNSYNFTGLFFLANSYKDCVSWLWKLC